MHAIHLTAKQAIKWARRVRSTMHFHIRESCDNACCCGFDRHVIKSGMEMEMKRNETNEIICIASYIAAW